jgi:NAD-dependent dihydropyrimidine dehydrogenase PreA subunit
MQGSLRRHTTEYIYLNSHLCDACWKCIEACPNGVIGRVAMPFHKHAKIENPGQCNGCRVCVKTCPQKAIIAYNTVEASKK